MYHRKSIYELKAESPALGSRKLCISHSGQLNQICGLNLIVWYIKICIIQQVIVIKHLHFVNLPLSQSVCDFITVKQFNAWSFHCVDLPHSQSICDSITVIFSKSAYIIQRCQYCGYWNRIQRYVDVFLSLEIGTEN